MSAGPSIDPLADRDRQPRRPLLRGLVEGPGIAVIARRAGCTDRRINIDGAAGRDAVRLRGHGPSKHGLAVVAPHDDLDRRSEESGTYGCLHSRSPLRPSMIAGVLLSHERDRDQ